jgi:hypothetical protein
LRESGHALPVRFSGGAMPDRKKKRGKVSNILRDKKKK